MLALPAVPARAKGLILAVRGRLQQPVRDLADASAVYGAARDKSGEGASTWPDGFLWRDGERVGRVSYNGRVWAELAFTIGAKPFYDPNPARNDA